MHMYTFHHISTFQRANGTTTFNAITFDTNILGDANKYAIVNQFNLTVINTATSDEGTYRCTAATTDYDAILTVVGKFLSCFSKRYQS